MYLVTWTTSDGEILGEKQATKEDARYQLKELFFQYAPEGYRREDITGYLDWNPRHKVIEKDGDIFADGSDQEGLEMRDRAIAIENMDLEEPFIYLNDEEAFIDASHSASGATFSARVFEC